MCRFHSRALRCTWLIGFIFTILVFFNSCNYIFFPEFKILDVSFTEEKVIVNFSHKPDRTAVIGAFTLTKDGDYIDGNFSFFDKSLIFVPEVKLVTGYDYAVTITTEAESSTGISLNENFVYKDSRKSNTVLPIVSGIKPANQEICETPITELVINFSKEIKPISFQNSFSINPAEDYRVEWVTPKEVKVLFDKELQPSTRYTVKIQKSLSDTQNNELADIFVSTFMNGTDKTSPVMKVLAKDDKEGKIDFVTDKVNEQIPNDYVLEINFDEPVEVDSIGSKVSFLPPITYELKLNKETKTSATITFKDVPEWGKEYTLKIKKGIKDLANNEIKDDIRYKFKFNHEKNRPITFLVGNFRRLGQDVYPIDAKNSLPYRISLNDYKDIDLPSSLFDQTNADKIEIIFDFIFSVSKEATEIPIKSALTSFKISSTSNCVPISLISVVNKLDPKIIQAYVDNEPSVKAAQDGGANIIGVQLLGNLSYESDNKTGMLNISISPDLVDNKKNKLKEGINLTYNKL